ncbi:MAG: DUF255 domain-containing protein [Anaerolineae bacterium]
MRFEDADTAEMMNSMYVSIKVDREERPDVDDICVRAVQAMSNHGGWPMTVFLTPDSRRFTAERTSSEPRCGMPSFASEILIEACMKLSEPLSGSGKRSGNSNRRAQA